MLLFLLFACTTYTFDVPQENNTEKNLNVVFSQAGFTRYAELNVVKAFDKFLGQSLGDMSFEIAGFSFSLKNVILSELQNPDIGILLLDDIGQADMSVRDFRLKLDFEFHLMHNTFPYMEDSGTGKLFFNVDNIHMMMWANQNEKCPGSLYINATHTSAKIESIKIEFESQMSYFYDAIMPFITSYLCDYLNDELSDTIVDMLLAAGNSFFENFSPVSHYYSGSALCSDQRWIGNVEIIDRQFIASISGAACVRDWSTDHCAGRPAYKAPPRCVFMFNADATYELSTNLFNQQLEYIWQMNSTYIQSTFGLTQLAIVAKRVARTGVVVEIIYEKDGVSNTIQALAHVVPDQRQWQDSTIVLAYFDLHVVSVTDPGTVSSDEATQLALGLNSIIREYGYTLINGYDMDLKHAQVVYCDENWIFVGANLYDYDTRK